MSIKFDARVFVRNLLDEGDRIACDDSQEEFYKEEKLPEFYNEEKFKRGQQFYHQNILGMFFAKMLGLIMSLALPKVATLLSFTKMSSEPRTAYKRYLSTIFHMRVWYDEEFYPGSRLWQSIAAVKCKHNSASKRSCSVGIGRITQKDMALAQFSFMGLAVAKKDMVGIHAGKDEDLEAFIHVWKIVGHLFGMEERFNICRDNLQETRAICDVLLMEIFKPEIRKMEPSFLELSAALIEGMWAMNPCLGVKVFLEYVCTVVGDAGRFKLGAWEQVHLWFVCITIYMLRFRLARFFHNMAIYMSFWLMENFPFLAYYKYGWRNSHVYILESHKV